MRASCPIHFLCGRTCAHMMEWTNEVTFEFLNLYENEPALWNSSLAQHKNKKDIHDAWLRIQTNLQDGTTSIVDLKKKKENLMSTYRKLRAKIKNSMETGTDDIYKPEWPFYDIIANFLDNVYRPRKTKSTIMITNESGDGSNDQCTEPTQNFEGDEKQDIPLNILKKTPKKKRKLDKTQNRMNKATASSTQLKELSLTPRKDVSSLYCDLLAEKLRGLQENTRELAMLEIDKLVFNLKQLEN